ncbi:UDP-GalNAc:beta-1,3-N-acetylgalactosaminyltransferase 2-like isoform X2 [Corticium candelabrum]|uniref:UDP-GalNAc:beta-1, 3-N-acetylgalactosaminyltransferase 2-like isoform X2 n=1 Tax=Corticium candelabrum TaxID=121492 RepID=UPI002E265E3A|nr:UDP-GalNAc:beta-1,3-N-acetylgalactosaminyltransferase 2-like isoform X2 [Corticium candelabrum]
MLVPAVLIEIVFRNRDLDFSTEFELAVVIPSARSNFELRRALRDTWFGDVKRRFERRIFAVFVIGSQSCHIHPAKRHTPFACQRSDLVCPTVQHTVMSVKLLSSEPEVEVPNGAAGYDFQVNFPVAVIGLGVYDHLSDGFQSNLNVTLYDTTTQKEIISVIFTPDDPGTLTNGIRFKLCSTTFILSKDYRATVVAEGFSVDDPSAVYSTAHVSLDTGGGLVSYLNVSRVSYTHGVFPEFDNSLMKVPMYFAAGAFIFEAHVENRTESQCVDQYSIDRDLWLETINEENLRLQNEATAYGDILFVDVVDVYRNIPAKMKAAYEWLSQHVKFKYLLKSDDDCFVHIEEILKGIEKNHLQDYNKVWWGNFRTHWAVEKFGKWAEVDYTAPAYPAFACGSGYVTSYDLIQWIANNSNSLKLYQGEDVCMGIWLSAICPNLVKMAVFLYLLF